jgi:hypothetical protein
MMCSHVPPDLYITSRESRDSGASAAHPSVGLTHRELHLALLRVAGGMLAHPFFQAVPIKNVRL